MPTLSELAAADPRLSTLDRIAIDLALGRNLVSPPGTAFPGMCAAIADTLIAALTLAAECPEYAEAVRREQIATVKTVPPERAAAILAERVRGIAALHPLPLRAMGPAPVEVA